MLSYWFSSVTASFFCSNDKGIQLLKHVTLYLNCKSHVENNIKKIRKMHTYTFSLTRTHTSTDTRTHTYVYVIRVYIGLRRNAGNHSSEQSKFCELLSTNSQSFVLSDHKRHFPAGDEQM
jgi:hypothetical protein